MLNHQSLKNRRLRSFVRRDSRLTAGQEQAFIELWPRYGIPMDGGQLNEKQIFGRNAPLFLEIGFGSGQSLLELSKLNPEQDFIGVETHKPGIGSLFQGIRINELTNLRVYYGDVIDVLEKCIPNSVLSGIQIFFPDPWPKRRHHARRLIQSSFLKLVMEKLKVGGTLHLATDWQEYAVHMMRVVTQEQRLINAAGVMQFSGRSPYRPIITKFERRALREGRNVWELQLSLGV